MDRDERRLVDGEKLGIFVDDRELELHFSFLERSAPESDAVLGLHAIVRSQPAAGERIRAGFDDRACARAARVAKLRLHEHVDALPRRFGRHAEHAQNGLRVHARGPLES
jgi:hypothetical protein